MLTGNGDPAWKTLIARGSACRHMACLARECLQASAGVNGVIQVVLMGDGDPDEKHHSSKC